ncbi:MFS transporter [Streptomyces sp. NPDC004129]
MQSDGKLVPHPHLQPRTLRVPRVVDDLNPSRIGIGHGASLVGDGGPCRWLTAPQDLRRPARSKAARVLAGAVVVELVGRERLSNAVSLNSAQFNVARAIGPAVTGLAVAAAGTGPVFLLNTASYLALLYGLITIRADELHAPREPTRSDTRLSDAFRVIRSTPDLLLPITGIAFVGTFGLNLQVTISLVAITVFNSGSAAYGYLSATYAIGSLVGALRGAGKRKPPTTRRLVMATVVFGTLEAVSGLMPGYATFLLLLLPTGLASVTVTTTANAMTQLDADPSLRGRIVSVYLLVLLVGTPVGAPLVGLVSDTLGARFSLILGGAISAVAALALSAVIIARTRASEGTTSLTAVASPPPIGIDSRFRPEPTPQPAARRHAA